MLTSSRNWEIRVNKFRSPSISTITSDDLSEILSFSSSNYNFDPLSLRPSISPAILPRRFPLHELRVATRDFSDIIGHDVFRGCLADGTPVAVKRKPKNEFLREVEIHSIVAHPNVIRILGVCITPNEHLLVYPLMVNGSVASSFRYRHESQTPLNWATRKGIALGVARGLAYLHEEIRDRKIIHCDIKAANILLDEDFNAVVGDFGLSIIAQHDAPYVEDAVRGTIGHIPPESFGTGRCSEKNDVFGYGVFLLELISGQEAFDLVQLAIDEDMMLLEWVKRIRMENKCEVIVDAKCRSFYMEYVVKLLVHIALLCTIYDPQKRPKMSQVVRMIQDGHTFDHAR